MAVAITGTPGVGKHTVAREISLKNHLDVIDINKIAKDENLYEPDGDTNDVDAEELKAVLNRRISAGSIIVGHLVPYVLDKTQIESMIVLRRNPYDLLKVYKERGYSDEKSMENAGSEILGIVAFDAMIRFEAVEINVSGKKIQDIVRETEAVISGKKDSEQIDWLGLVTENGDLRRFFAD